MTEVHIGWLPEDTYRDKTFGLLIRELLIRTPALDTSFRSDGFVERFHLKNVSDALTLYAYLTDGVEVAKAFDSAGDLAEDLKDRHWDGDDFWQDDEFIAMVIPSDTKKGVSAAVGRLPQNTALYEEKRKVTIKYFNLDDAIFKHIRNSLAHGLFGKFETPKGAVVYAFQDSNTNHAVSARMVLSEERLKDWITRFHVMEQKGV